MTSSNSPASPEPKAILRQALYTALAAVPTGTVITYGQLGAEIGLLRGARQVGRLLSQLPEDSQLPWHRVINAQGKLSFPIDSPTYVKQRQKLEAEGIRFTNHKINLRIYRYNAP